MPKWNWDKVRKPSDLQKRKLVALALSKVAKVIFTNHLYKFNGQVYLQMDGGPIGDDATMVAAELVMFTFVLKIRILFFTPQAIPGNIMSPKKFLSYTPDTMTS